MYRLIILLSPSFLGKKVDFFVNLTERTISGNGNAFNIKSNI